MNKMQVTNTFDIEYEIKIESNPQYPDRVEIAIKFDQVIRIAHAPQIVKGSPEIISLIESLIPFGKYPTWIRTYHTSRGSYKEYSVSIYMDSNVPKGLKKKTMAEYIRQIMR